MHQLETAPAPAARHVFAPVRVVLPEVTQARRQRVMVGMALTIGLVAVTVLFMALIRMAVPA